MFEGKKSVIIGSAAYLGACFCVIAVLGAGLAVWAQTPETSVKGVYNPWLQRTVSQKAGDDKSGGSGNLVQFCNPAPILIPAGQPGTTQGISAPYPSPIMVTGLGNISSMSITLNNVSHTFAGDIDVLLVSPGGLKFIPLANVGSSTGFDTTATVTLIDSAPTQMPTNSTPIAGSYKPTGNRDSTIVNFPAPAPPGPYNSPSPRPVGIGTFNGLFGGTSPNGMWNLYVFDFNGGDVGMMGGWCIDIVAPTAANASVSGRVLSASGWALPYVGVSISGGGLSQPLTATTNMFGYFRLDGIPTGETYVLSVISKKYTFSNPDQVITVNGDLTGLDFIGNEQ